MLVTSLMRTVEVERGPGWLFVKVKNADEESPDMPPLADELWSILEKHFAYRLVLELETTTLIDSRLIAQLVWLNNLLLRHQGVLRLCGLSEENKEVIKSCRLGGTLCEYASRMEAVMSFSQQGCPSV